MTRRKPTKSNILRKFRSRRKLITQDELENLLALEMTIRTAGDELTHRVKAGARIERGAWTVRPYPETYPDEPLIIPNLDHVLGAIDELEGR
jgi:hypothetical protein